MMIPLKAELRIIYKPIVTYAVVAICIIIYALQVNNKHEIEDAAVAYCSGINNFKSEYNELDFLSNDRNNCPSWVISYYGLSDKQHIGYFFLEDYKSFSQYSNTFTPINYFETLRLFKKRISDFSEYAPINLDGALVYDPSTLNLFTMVTSVLSHGSFMHLFFNLVFFLAFAPALEALVGNSWKFLGVLALMILGTNLVYAVAMGSASYPTPTLGLSGIVMGMMGFAASFMPTARIKTFYYIIVLPTPVWLLSTYYIGWDIYDLYTRTDHGGVNITVHVTGGIIGVLAMMLFRERHKEVSDELHDEITFMKNKRQSLSDSTASKAEDALKTSKQEFDKNETAYIELLHKYIRVNNNSAAISMLLKDYDPIHSTVERYEFLINEIQKWNKGRAFECMTRFVIDLRLEQHQTGIALKTAKTLYQIKEDILIANPEHVLLLAQAAKEIHEYELAYAVVRDADKRYWGKVDSETCLLLEIELLHLYLNKSTDALKLVKSVFDERGHPHRTDVILYSKKIGLIGSH